MRRRLRRKRQRVSRPRRSRKRPNRARQRRSIRSIGLATEPEPEIAASPGGRPAISSGPSEEPPATAASSADEEGPGDEPFDGAAQAKLVTHLQDKLPPYEFNQVAPGQFVVFLSEYCTVPIVLDSESLLKAGKGAKTKITVKSQGGTVEQALKTALARHGLTYHVEAKRLVITAAEKK